MWRLYIIQRFWKKHNDSLAKGRKEIWSLDQTRKLLCEENMDFLRLRKKRIRGGSDLHVRHTTGRSYLFSWPRGPVFWILSLFSGMVGNKSNSVCSVIHLLWQLKALSGQGFLKCFLFGSADSGFPPLKKLSCPTTSFLDSLAKTFFRKGLYKSHAGFFSLFSWNNKTQKLFLRSNCRVFAGTGNHETRRLVVVLVLYPNSRKQWKLPAGAFCFLWKYDAKWKSFDLSELNSACRITQQGLRWGFENTSDKGQFKNLDKAGPTCISPVLNCLPNSNIRTHLYNPNSHSIRSKKFKFSLNQRLKFEILSFALGLSSNHNLNSLRVCLEQNVFTYP